MKKFNLLLVSLLYTFIMQGQNKELSIGIIGSPDYYNFNKKLEFDHKYKTKINYSTGLRLQYFFTKKIGITTGLNYSTKGYFIYYGFKVNDPNDPLIPIKSSIKANYLDVPLLINFKFKILNKVSLLISSGIITSFLIYNNETSTMANGIKKETEFLKLFFKQKTNSNLQACEIDLGLKYDLNEKLFLSFVPYFRYGLNKINDNILKSNSISFGAQLGIYYYLN